MPVCMRMCVCYDSSHSPIKSDHWTNKFKGKS